MVIYTFGITPEWRMLAGHYQDHIFSLGNPYTLNLYLLSWNPGARGVVPSYTFIGVSVLLFSYCCITKSRREKAIRSICVFFFSFLLPSCIFLRRAIVILWESKGTPPMISP